MSPIDASDLARSLVGTTIPTPALSHPNSVLAVEGSSVIVATEDSPEGAPVALRMLQRGIDILFEAGEVQIAPRTFDGYRRSSAIGAILATLPATEVSEPPVHIRLTNMAPLRDGLAQACAGITEQRSADNVRAEDPYHQLMVHALPGAIRPIVDNEAGFKVRGSAGQVNFPWAETPWVAVFDRLVTESALRGHYIVYLIHPAGAGVYLSLNQAVTEVRAGGRGRYREVLEAQATRFRSHLAPSDVGGLIQGPIDLAGRGDRTRGYEAGNIVALFMSADQLPHDAELVTHLRRFLALYERTTAGLDEEESAANVDAPGEAQTGTESRRYRWHLRAEGRNRTVVKRAKERQGYWCRVCQRHFVEELGEIGKRCIDAHHLTPFSDMDNRPRSLDPDTDFAIVCANCHRMLHSETPPLEPEGLAARLAPTS